MSNQTRQVSPLSLRASLTPGSVNLEKRTVELVWTTGAKVLRSSWFDGQFWEELSVEAAHVRMGRLNNGAPFLANHDGYDVARQLGVVESAKLEKGRGVATVRFAKAEDDPEADKVFRKIADGIIQNVSVGYRTYKVEKIEDVEQKIPTLRAIDWEPYEISAVSMGADDGAGFRSAPAPTNEVIIVSPNQEQKMTEEERKRLEAEALAKRQAEENQKRESEIQERTLKLERERASGIRSAVKAARLGDDFAVKLIEDGTALDAARTAVLDELAKRDAAVKTEQHVTVGDTDADKFARMAVAMLVTRSASVAADVRAAKEKGVAELRDVSFDAGDLRGASLMGLARECLERRGISTRRLTNDQIVQRAFTMTRDSGYGGVDDFPVLLENAMGKILLGSYSTIPNTWSLFCGTDTVPDFRASPRYRLGQFGTLDSVAENGEFKNKSIPDGSKVTIDVATKGNIIAITRQLIVNDDMGAINQLLTQYAGMAQRSIETDVYAILNANAGLGPTQADTQPLFHANRANVNATGSAISVAGIDADRVVMANQKDMSNVDFLDLRPSILLLPIGLGGQARQINEMQFDGATSKFQQPNYVRGLFRTIVDSPRLTGTRRYLLTDPNVAALIKVVFLEGAPQGPTMETQNGWRIDGTEMKLKIDYKAQVFDPKAAVTNAGV